MTTPQLTDDELQDLAHSAYEEAMSLGLSVDTFLRYFKGIRNRLATQAQGQDAAPAEQMQEFWLWKNFVDGRPEYWAFDNPYPINLTDGDPQTLGEPCGYAIFKPSRNGRPDVPRAQVIAAIKRAKE